MKPPFRYAILPGLAAAAVALAGCSTPDPGQLAIGGIHDPNEATNRKIHEFNKSVDRMFFGPTSRGVSGVIPAPVQTSIGAFAENVSMPRVMVNGLLQGDFRTAGIALSRFLINSTVGFAGLADPATDFKLPKVDADFGQTLHVWGFGEGPYQELPFFGPSTRRDTIGLIADFALNPLSYVVEYPVRDGIIVKGLELLTDRGRYSGTVESILYGSEDSYAQARIIYIQNRRFQLAGSGGGESYADPYEDPYGDSGTDPYSDPSLDPYEDPYAE